MASVRVTLASMTLSDGEVISLPPAGVVLIVGPNNSGKSRALRDIQAALASGTGGIVIPGISMVKEGSAQDLESHFREQKSVFRSEGGAEAVVLGGGAQDLALTYSWWSVPNQLPLIVEYFILHADTESRLMVSKPVAALNLYAGVATEALHRLYADPSVEHALDDISRQAFGFGLVLDRYTGGSHWAIRVGELPPATSVRPTREFLDALKEMPLLHEQGDGVKSLIGLMLLWYSGKHSVALIDEPEAFLHPPQAHFLGRALSRDAATHERLAILSTHSSDVVRGVLDSSSDVTVLRLTREADVNHVAAVDNASVTRLWSDPLLRYSNLLEGLFSDGVIVCEADADCKYYAAVLDTSAEVSGVPEERRNPDVLFTHCGGKHRLHIAIGAMQAASVPVCAIADFDVLRERDILKRIVESLGGSLEGALAEDLLTVSSALSSQAKAPSVAHVTERLTEILDDMTDGPLRVDQAEKLRAVLRTETGWDKAKKSGLASLPGGEVYQAAERLLEVLAGIGLHIVPMGELESFVPQAGAHGPQWVSQVLQRGLHAPPHSVQARTFMVSVISGLFAAGS